MYPTNQRSNTKLKKIIAKSSYTSLIKPIVPNSGVPVDGFDDRFVLMNELTHGYKFESLLITHDQDVVE